ncbi:M23 family metallopeptidase [Mangrovibacterium lignilyticum]|uniref:M23 family metallopeptidase n=1 Tax=Mangrovibacterium lignilyticum TaxID=2668052 RepID=UPI0013D7FA08|nr:M23 family metallopeptidase [Mangrovibacterium lignilyticum]
MKYVLLSILLFLLKTPYNPSIEANYFAPPLKVPMYLAGNFGELRTNHFHSGIDIKTQGKTGLPVYAAAEGTIVRINISAVGFGTALYIEHPDGYTTVYGHLSGLRDDLAEYARNVQYDKESFSVDINVPKGKFKVSKGELVAYSGNSGSSGGPHLHFEIRDTESQHPINPLLFNFKIKDDMPPKLMSLMLYPLSDGAQIDGQSKQKPFALVYYDGAYHLKGNPAITAGGEIGFGLQALDYLDGSWAKCGVYEINLTVNEKLIYSFKMNELSFDESRYLNSHIDYSYLFNHHSRYHKNWLEDGNELNNYPIQENKGKVEIKEGQAYTVSYLVKDVYGNVSRLIFNLQGKSPMKSSLQEAGIPVHYNQELAIKKEHVQAKFEAGSFYSNFKLDYQELPSEAGLYSERIQLHQSDIPVHQSYKLRIKAENLPSELEPKAIIVAIAPKNGKQYAVGGNYQSDGWVETMVRQLGTFAIATDTEAPDITPVNIKNHSSLTNRDKVSFKLSDDLSGIDSYRGEIDGHWVLFEYDAKNRLLEYNFDEKRLQLGKSHNLQLVVKDGVGNESIYEAKFYR